jgi:hypothetical protein
LYHAFALSSKEILKIFLTGVAGANLSAAISEALDYDTVFSRLPPATKKVSR